MTAAHTDSPLAAPLRAGGGGTDRRHRSAVAALALATVAALATAGSPVPASASAPTSSGLSRVVVSAVGQGASGVAIAADAVVAAGGRVLDSLPLVSGVAAELPEGAVLAPGLVVSPDRPVEVAQGAPYADGPASTVRETIGLAAPTGEGEGVTVAVVDTGVRAVGDLAARLSSVDVSGAGHGDGYGHGTFVAGVVAGSGAASGGRYAGVAPGAHVLSVRVADDEGRTNLLTVLRGLEAAAAHDADVVNLALSSYSPLPYQLDPLTVALGALWDRGTVVVVPAGNDGPDAATITSPGVHPRLLTVGALDEGGTGTRGDDVVAAFSARGPAPQGVPKPELVAPGRSIVSLRSPGSAIDAEHASAAVGEDYFKGSGTSFATAVTAGAAAALLAERDLTPDQVKALLVGTSYAAAGLADADAAGAGGLDLAAALAAPAHDVDAPAAGKGKGKGKGKGGQASKEVAVPGTAGEWQPLLQALLRGDAGAAARSWSRLSPEAKAWVASSWSALPADLRADLVEEWTQRNWGHLTPEEWAQVDWAGRNWGASRWSQRNWGQRNWGVITWSETDQDWLVGWEGRNWGQRNWAGRNWGGRNWGGRNWGGSTWTDDEWAGRNWGGRNWGGSTWTGSTWTASSWADSTWAGRNWAAASWDS